MRVSRVVSLVIALVSARPAAKADEAVAGEGNDLDRARLEALDVSFGTRGSLPRQTGTGLGDRVSRYRAFVRARLQQDEFYATTLPRLFALLSSRLPVQGFDVPYVLEKAKTRSGREYYHLGKPCAPREQRRVAPWWDQQHPVWICDEAYRPTVTHYRAGERESFCEVGGDECGCGPHLVNCARDEAQHAALIADVQAEPIRTIQWVIQAGRPFSEILTTTKSVRSALGDFFYARNRLFKSGSLPTSFQPTNDAGFVARERDPEFSGGILTTPQLLFWDDAPRLVTAMIWDDFLCAPLVSSAVSAAAMFHSGGSAVNARYRFDQNLTTANGCRDCHTRLDYGLLPFSGFTRNVEGFRFVSERQSTAATRFFVRDANDRRAEGPATPGWLGATLTRQPEFSACMVRKVEELVYGGYPVPEAAHTAFTERFVREASFATLLEDVVIAARLGVVPER